MGSLAPAADDRMLLEAALKSAHEFYRAKNELSLTSHHDVSSVSQNWGASY